MPPATPAGHSPDPNRPASRGARSAPAGRGAGGALRTARRLLAAAMAAAFLAASLVVLPPLASLLLRAPAGAGSTVWALPALLGLGWLLAGASLAGLALGLWNGNAGANGESGGDGTGGEGGWDGDPGDGGGED